eukprot:TRINITY_DN13463_c0_g1_i1.p1 TRINITY_DN13463_c0_g1~~TRINITY_DN13463_c0_g1_i1.p1  ORF type:complete len:769 (+),score=185.64 TRINITY_DN13463_c0_g1_i1:82-2307(+)
MGGSSFVGEVADVPGGMLLVALLLSSERPSTALAAAGLLRNIAGVDEWQEAVVQAGAVEAAVGALERHKDVSQVMEQAVGLLANLSAKRAGVRWQLVHLGAVPAIVAMLDARYEGERQVAAQCVASLVEDSQHWQLLADCGVITKLARLVLDETGTSKTTRQEARTALSVLAQNPSHRFTVMENNLMVVPLIGANAYRSFRPILGAEAAVIPEIKPEARRAEGGRGQVESVFGAGELLLGLQMSEETMNLDEATAKEREGRARQHFLARIGVAERGLGKERQEDEAGRNTGESQEEKTTVLPRWDGVPRLVLIIGLDDPEVAAQGAEAMAHFAVTNENRQMLRDAGALPHLVSLLGSGNERATYAAAHALEEMAASPEVRKAMNSHEAGSALVALLRAPDAPPAIKEKVAATLLRITEDRGEAREERKAAIEGLVEALSEEGTPEEVRVDAEETLERVALLKGDPRGMIMAAGAAKPLLQMLSHGSLRERQKAAAILSQLAEEDESNAMALVSGGAVAALESVLALGEHPDPDEPRVVRFEEPIDPMAALHLWEAQGAAATLVTKLAEHASLRETLFSSRLKVLLSDLLSSAAPLEIKSLASDSLLLLHGPRAVLTKVTSHETILRLAETLLSAEATDSDKEEVAEKLQRLALFGRPEYREAMARAGVVPPLLQLLRAGGVSERVKECVLTVLHFLIEDEENLAVMVSAGAEKILEGAINSKTLRPKNWKLALYILRALPV